MLQVRHLQGIRLLFFQHSKEYCRQGAVYSICSIKHKINTAHVGGVLFFALFTLLSFFLRLMRKNHEKKLNFFQSNNRYTSKPLVIPCFFNSFFKAGFSFFSIKSKVFSSFSLFSLNCLLNA